MIFKNGQQDTSVVPLSIQHVMGTERICFIFIDATPQTNQQQTIELNSSILEKCQLLNFNKSQIYIILIY